MMFGTHHTQETKAKIGLKNKGRIKSAEEIKKRIETLKKHNDRLRAAYYKTLQEKMINRDE